MLFIANHRNTVILAILQCNILKRTIQTLISEWIQKILANEVDTSYTVANVTITKCRQNVMLAYFN